MSRFSIFRNGGFLAAAVLALGLANAAPASATSIMIGDDDGYGTGFQAIYGPLGLPDGGTVVGDWPGSDVGLGGSNYDGRDAGEAVATNGAEFTDVYSAIYPGYGPNPDLFGEVKFALDPGVNMSSGAQLTIDLGDFEAREFGPLTAYFNGLLQADLFNIYTPLNATEDVNGLTQVVSFVIPDAAIQQANSDRQFVLRFERGPNYLDTGVYGDKDFVAFDYFQLDFTPEPVPEPATMLLFGTGAAVLAARRRLAKNKKTNTSIV